MSSRPEKSPSGDIGKLAAAKAQLAASAQAEQGLAKDLAKAVSEITRLDDAWRRQRALEADERVTMARAAADERSAIVEAALGALVHLRGSFTAFLGVRRKAVSGEPAAAVELPTAKRFDAPCLDEKLLIHLHEARPRAILPRRADVGGPLPDIARESTPRERAAEAISVSAPRLRRGVGPAPAELPAVRTARRRRHSSYEGPRHSPLVWNRIERSAVDNLSFKLGPAATAR